MTDEELDRLVEKLSPQKTKEKPRKKGLFSKVVVTLCILIVIAYTSICLLMQWARGMQPEPQLTISFFAAESDARYAPIAAAIRPTVTGETISVNDSVEWPLQGLTLYGKSTQDGTPTPDNPIPIVSAGDGGTITVTVSDGADQSQTLPVSTPNGLPGIPVTSGGNYTDADGQQWVCDEVDFRRGKYVQRVKKFVATNDTYIVSMNPYAPNSLDIVQPFRVQGWLGEIINRSTLMSENFKNENPWNRPEESAWTVEQSVDFNIYNERLGTNAETTSEEAVAALKEWIVDNPLTFLCQLVTPIETDLTPEQLQAYAALKAYAPSTTIQTDSTPAAGLAVRYVADAQKYIDGKLSTINTQLLEVKTNV